MFQLKEKALKKPNILQRLFKTSIKENAWIEINNLFVQKPLLEIQLEDFAIIGKKYNVDVHRQYSTNLKNLFDTYLFKCIEDHIITEEEKNNLQHLKGLLMLTDAEFGELLRERTTVIYKESYQAVAKKGKITEIQRDNLKKLQTDLLLSDYMVRKINDEVGLNILSKHVETLTKDERLSDSDMDELVHISKSLSVELNLDNYDKVKLAKYRMYYQLENGTLPIVRVDINLQKAEICHFRTDTSLYEYRTTTTGYRTRGVGISIKITKGVYYRTGGGTLTSMKSTELTEIDKGVLYLTNKRLIFIGSQKTTNIKLDKILSFNPFADGIEIIKETGKNPTYKVDSRVSETLYLMLARLASENSN